MSKWVKENLDSLTTEELCARLRGHYGNGVTYGTVPLQEEAARRIEKMALAIAAAKAFDLDLSSDCDGPLRDEFRSLAE